MSPFSGKLDVAVKGEREIVITRSVAAPRALVFDAFTKPELIQRWLHGPDEWPMVHCAVDARPGGAIRYVWRNAEKGDMAMSGTFREVVPPQRLVHTEIFDEDWTEGEAVVTTLFDEADGVTTVTMILAYSSETARDAALKSGMNEGMAQSYDRLDRMLVKLVG